jgi:hypothetical protein
MRESAEADGVEVDVPDQIRVPAKIFEAPHLKFVYCRL